VSYTTAPNTFGDRLVVGTLASDLTELQLAPADFPNQRYCDQVQLAHGFFADAYVPSQAELSGDFSAFAGLLVNPDTGLPFPNGQILDAESPPPKAKSLWAWRISSEKFHTILTLANTGLAYAYDASKVTIYGNVVKASNGQTVSEVLGNGDGSQSLQTFTLHQKPVTYVSAPTPAGADSTLVARVNDVEWHEVSTLADLEPTDRVYITQTDDTDQTSLIFGTGEHGARLPTGAANVSAVYRYGIGKAGNVKAQQISQLVTRPLGVKDVINPLPATGGADRDSRDQARRNVPLAVMALDRLVSTEDYADFARTFAGIGKATAARLSDGRRQMVHVTIAGVDDIPIDVNSDLYRNVVQALHLFGDPNQPIQVAVRRLKLLVASAGVQVKPDYQWESVEPEIRAALLDTLGFDRRELGQSAFSSEIISTVQAVQGVAYVDLQIFGAVPESITPDQLAGLAATLGPNPYVNAELAHVDFAATDPSKRILPAELAIFTPDIPDTLRLTEISK
jgi:predicted phage baseplate assembly protein